MPNFKPKANKKIKVNKKSNITLDSKHNKKMAEFNNIQTREIPNLQKKKKQLKKRLKENLSIEDRLDIEDQIRDIKKKIILLKTKKKEYLLDNSEIIFDYFEKKKKLSEGKNTEKKKVLYSFFDKNKNKKKPDKIGEDTNVTKYLCNVDTNFINLKNYVIDYEICDKCGGELVKVDYKGLVICNTCGIQKTFLVEHEKPSYKEPPKEVCFYAYKRINHFREILAQFQAKETTLIPDDVIENIKLQIKKERLDINLTTNKRLKEVLKKLKYNKYYEHIPFIKDKLGIKPPVMTPELEETLCNLFMDIQVPYAKYCPDDRVNFLNYYYTIYKLCELLNQRQFLSYFPMLKDREKRIEQDEIWKNICWELDWKFIPTI